MQESAYYKEKTGSQARQPPYANNKATANSEALQIKKTKKEAERIQGRIKQYDT